MLDPATPASFEDFWKALKKDEKLVGVHSLGDLEGEMSMAGIDAITTKDRCTEFRRNHDVGVQNARRKDVIPHMYLVLLVGGPPIIEERGIGKRT